MHISSHENDVCLNEPGSTPTQLMNVTADTMQVVEAAKGADIRWRIQIYPNLFTVDFACATLLRPDQCCSMGEQVRSSKILADAEPMESSRFAAGNRVNFMSQYCLSAQTGVGIEQK